MMSTAIVIHTALCITAFAFFIFVAMETTHELSIGIMYIIYSKSMYLNCISFGIVALDMQSVSRLQGSLNLCVHIGTVTKNWLCHLGTNSRKQCMYNMIKFT